MNVQHLTLPSHWGTQVVQRHFQQGSSTLVVAFPGRHYPCELPLLYYAGTAAIQSKYDLLLLEYGYQAARVNLDINDLSTVVDECTQAISKVIEGYETILFVSKSLGTVIASNVHEQLGVNLMKHLFITPLKATLPYMNKFGGTVIYGTSDSLFGPGEAAELEGIEHLLIVPIPGADHSLEVERVEDSLGILTRIVNLYMEFYRTHG